MHAVVLILQEFLWLCLTAFTLSFKIFLNITSLYNEMMWLYTASLYLYHVACTQGCCACVVNGLSCCCYSLDRRAKPSNRKRSRAYVRPCRVAARNTMRRWSKTMLLQNLSDLEMRILACMREHNLKPYEHVSHLEGWSCSRCPDKHGIYTSRKGSATSMHTTNAGLYAHFYRIIAFAIKNKHYFCTKKETVDSLH